jgi:hypothetical protein
MDTDKKILLEKLFPIVLQKLQTLNLIKEDESMDIQSDLINRNESMGNHLRDKDEIGEIYVIKAPDEQSTHENIVIKTNIPDLLLKQQNGELSLDSIRYIVKKEGTAIRNANKLIKEFSKDLLISRKSQLENLINTRNGINKQLEGYMLLKKDKMLDETANQKIDLIKNRISELDNEIGELQTKIKNAKSK